MARHHSPLRSPHTLRTLHDRWRVIAPRFADTKRHSLSLWLKAGTGLQVGLLHGTSASVRTQTARLCRHVLEKSGLHDAHASFSIICGTYYRLNGEAGMAELAEQAAEWDDE